MTDLESLVCWLREMPVFVRDGKIVYRCKLSESEKETIKLYKPELILELTKPYAGSTRYSYVMDKEEHGVVRIIHHHRDMDYLRALLGPNVHIRPLPEKTPANHANRANREQRRGSCEFA